MSTYHQTERVSSVSLYATSAYSGSDVAVDATERFTSVMSLHALLGGELDFEGGDITGTSGTDNVLINVYKRDDSSFTGIEKRIQQIEIKNTGTDFLQPVDIIALINGPGYYRFGMITDPGGTNTFKMSVTCNYWRGSSDS